MFIYFDGDDVGSALEILLLDGHIQEASAHSRNVTEAIQGLARELEALNARIHFSAGDEVLAELDALPEAAELQDVRTGFRQATGCTISCGIGERAFDAVINLRRAKLRGKDRIVSSSTGAGISDSGST